MPWTKTNYPASMKKLPALIRNKAITIANAMLKENKKMNEGKLIATAISRAKEMEEKGGSKKKTKTVAKKKVKTASKTKAKRVVRAKAKKTVKGKAKAPVKKVAGKKVKIVSKAKSKEKVKAKTKKLAVTKATKAKGFEFETPKITHGEDLHLIPVAGEVHPVRIAEANKVENIFHHNLEVAFRRENQRVKESLSTRKSSKPIYRNRGRGS